MYAEKTNADITILPYINTCVIASMRTNIYLFAVTTGIIKMKLLCQEICLQINHICGFKILNIVLMTCKTLLDLSSFVEKHRLVKPVEFMPLEKLIINLKALRKGPKSNEGASAAGGSEDKSKSMNSS